MDSWEEQQKELARQQTKLAAPIRAKLKEKILDPAFVIAGEYLTYQLKHEFIDNELVFTANLKMINRDVYNTHVHLPKALVYNHSKGKWNVLLVYGCQTRWDIRDRRPVLRTDYEHRMAAGADEADVVSILKRSVEAMMSLARLEAETNRTLDALQAKINFVLKTI